MIYQTLHDIFFGSRFDLHQTIGLFTFLIGAFGLHVSFKFRRNLEFRLKLGIVFMFPLVGGIFGMIVPDDQFHVIQHTMNVAFMIMVTILYWREVKGYMTTEGYHKKSFGSYIDDIPDLVWIKDLEQRYTYVNKAFIDMAGIESNNILGKNDSEIGEYLEENDINYSFSMGNFRNDSQVSIFSKPRLIIETGIIDGRFAALQVYKKPLYNSDITSARKHVGYIGIGRDLTYDVEDHNMMSEFIAEERIEEALKLFEIHKNRYQTT